MYKYAKFDQNISCGLRVISIFTNCYTDGQTYSHNEHKCTSAGCAISVYSFTAHKYVKHFSLFILGTRTTCTSQVIW